MADTEARKAWERENTERINMKLNRRTDADILQALEGKQKQTEIKRLLRIAIHADEKADGFIVLHIPKSLHRDLIAEAKRESVDLETLVIYKLTH